MVFNQVREETFKASREKPGIHLFVCFNSGSGVTLALLILCILGLATMNSF